MKSYLQFTDQLLEKVKLDTSRTAIFNNKVRQILRTYGAIPLNKEDATEIIQRIVGSEVKYSTDPNHPSNFIQPVLGKDVDFNLMKPSNKVRIYNYLKSLITSKTIRGDSFEGLVAGLYDGEISDSKSSKYDVILNNEPNEKISVKFLDSNQERPVLGNIKKDIMNFYTLNPSKTLKSKSLNVILNKLGVDESSALLNAAFSDVTHFLFAYPIPGTLDIKCLMITRESLVERYIYESDLRYAPKQKGSYQIRVNINKLLATKDDDDMTWILKSPIISEQDFQYLSVGNVDVAKKLFGTDKDRMRGSVLNSIIKYGDFKKINGREFFVFDFEKYKHERGH